MLTGCMLINEYATILLSFTQKPYEYPQSQDYGAQKMNKFFRMANHSKSPSIKITKQNDCVFRTERRSDKKIVSWSLVVNAKS